MMMRIALPRSQAGLSLVELMVGLTLGLVLMIGVLQVFLASRQTYASNEAMARLQENGRFALEFIASNARQSGYTDPRTRLETGLSTDPIVGSTANGCTNQKGLANVDVLACSSDGGGSATDSIGFAMQPPLVDGVRRDCLGNSVGTAADDDKVIINHFGIVVDPVTQEASLGCHAWNVTDNGWNPGSGIDFQPLIEGVDSLQVLYGIDDSSGTSRTPSRYVGADSVTDWTDVLAVRISVLANSVNPVSPPPTNRNFVLLDAEPLAPVDFLGPDGNPDDRARQIFSTTIHLKNAD